ncbi:drug/metabolite transporter (DMT)-like permease [Rhodovulum iodosum]|uniref:Drug/metabolite transporter (DMT)-like permease n=1 Tax=Rhodovulum iodosum TaxID=68291 RepID=A0ABV3XTK7_9RHOB|nr:DMT family transporter [Rhodovulum robiginosum]RSK32842.1 DMT family transporter [Rhodovulum robiginosum]
MARALHDSIEPFQLNYLRWAVAGVILLPFTIRHWQPIAAAWATHPLKLLILGFLAVTAFNWLLYSGLQHSSASAGGVMFALSAVIIVFFSRLWRGRLLRQRDIAGAALAVLGVGLAMLDEMARLASSHRLYGPIFLFAASTVWALYTVCLRRWSIPLSPSACLATTVFSGLVIMTPAAVFMEMPDPRALLDPALASGILFLGAGSSVAAFCAWQAGVARFGAARAGVFLNLVPVFAVLLGLVFLDEALTLPKAAGVALVLTGLTLNQTGNRPL